MYTPQLVIDGRFGLVGSDSREASAAILRAVRERKVPIEISNVVSDRHQVSAHIELHGDPSIKTGPAVLYLAIADNRAESQVVRGENSGRSLAHVAVTRVLKQFGAVDLDTASVREVTLLGHAAASGSRLIVFLQDPRSGHILGVSVRKL